jgi:hypothetical protein
VLQVCCDGIVEKLRLFFPIHAYYDGDPCDVDTLVS